MLIDDYMPAAEFAERHAIRVAAPPERAWEAVRALDLGPSPVVKALFALRSLPALFAGKRMQGRGLGTTMERRLENGFVLLAEQPPR